MALEVDRGKTAQLSRGASPRYEKVEREAIGLSRPPAADAEAVAAGGGRRQKCAGSRPALANGSD